MQDIGITYTSKYNYPFVQIRTTTAQPNEGGMRVETIGWYTVEVINPLYPELCAYENSEALTPAFTAEVLSHQGIVVDVTAATVHIEK